MNKKILTFLIIALLLVMNVNASIWATIGMKGLQMVNPQAAQAVQVAICAASVVACAEGYVVGQVSGEAMQELAKTSPEAVKAISTYNQVKGYVSEGAQIVKELQLNENGEVTSGSMAVTKEAGIGNLVNPNLKQGDIKITNANLDVSTVKDSAGNDIRSVTVKTGENGQLTIGKNTYTNVEKGGVFKLDENGQLKEAEFTSKGGEYALGDQKLEVPNGAKIVYKNGEARVIAKEGDVIQTSAKLETGGYEQTSRRIAVLKDGDVNIAGDKVYGKNFEIDNRLKIISGSAYLEDKNGIIIGERTNAFAKDLGVIYTSGTSSVMFYNEGVTPCENICYPNYMAASGNKLELRTHSVDGFAVSFSEGNKYTNKELAYLVRGDSSVELDKIGNEITSVIKTTQDGLVKVDNGKQRLEYKNSEIYTVIENGEAKIGGAQSSLITDYESSSILSSEDGSASYCGLGLPSATGFVVFDIITGMAGASPQSRICTTIVEGDKKIIFNIESKPGRAYGGTLKINSKTITTSDLLRNDKGDYEYYLDKDNKIIIDPITGKIRVERLTVEALGQRFDSDQTLTKEEMKYGGMDVSKYIKLLCPEGYIRSGDVCKTYANPNPDYRIDYDRKCIVNLQTNQCK